MTGASLFNWDYDRRTLQGGIDLFGDSFGKSRRLTNQANNESTEDPHSTSERNDNDEIGERNDNDENGEGNDNDERDDKDEIGERNDNDEIGERDPTNTVYQDYLSTHIFPNNWRTVLRINKRSPSFITHDYVDAMFSGVFGTWPRKVEVENPNRQERKPWGCNLV